MAEFYENLPVINPLNEDFDVYYDGHLITVPAKSDMMLQRDIALHVSKHLSRRILQRQGYFDDKQKGERIIGRAVKSELVKQVQDAMLNQTDYFKQISKSLDENPRDEEEEKSSVDENSQLSKLDHILEMPYAKMKKEAARVGINSQGMKKEELANAILDKYNKGEQ